LFERQDLSPLNAKMAAGSLWKLLAPQSSISYSMPQANRSMLQNVTKLFFSSETTCGKLALSPQECLDPRRLAS
jgi:hypothetical protein